MNNIIGKLAPSILPSSIRKIEESKTVFAHHVDSEAIERLLSAPRERLLTPKVGFLSWGCIIGVCEFGLTPQGRGFGFRVCELQHLWTARLLNACRVGGLWGRRRFPGLGFLGEVYRAQVFWDRFLGLELPQY